MDEEELKQSTYLLKLLKIKNDEILELKQDICELRKKLKVYYNDENKMLEKVKKEFEDNLRNSIFDKIVSMIRSYQDGTYYEE